MDTGHPIAQIKSRPRQGQQPTDQPPFLLSSPGETPIWLAVALGITLCLITGVQVGRLLLGQGVSAGVVAGLETLYVLMLALIALVRRLSARRWMIFLGLGLVLASAVALGLTDAFLLGYVLFELIPLIIVYRLPGRWSLPILGVTAALFATIMLLRALLPLHPSGAISDLWGNLAILVLVACIAATLRSRTLLILRLRNSQAQLQAEMEYTAELAAARERARIARDIHDVLAHSLTVLSIQAQAARQIITQQPDKAAQLLDEMAGVLRESIAESRRVVGLLREATQTPGDTGPLGARLLTVAERFAERTGMKCVLEETGAARELSEAQESAIQFALQEALTNAYRHGGAQHVRIALAWQTSAVSLDVCDDGTGQPALTFDGQGGNGLRGMRERAAALGGSLSAGPQSANGFAITMTLPLTVVDLSTAERVG